MNIFKDFLLKGIIVIIIISLLGGCSQKTTGTEKNKKYKIGICIANFGDKYGSYSIEEMKKYSKSLNDVEIIYLDAKSDSNTQLSQVENLISQRVDAIVIDPVYTDSSKQITEKAKTARIPIISLMLPLENQEDVVCYLAPDSKQEATLQMEFLAKKMNYKGNVAIIMGPIEDRAQKVRTEACREVIAKYPEMKIVAEQTAQWNRARGNALMENWLQSGKKIDAVACNNDEMAIGALKSIEASGKLDKIIVGGIDGTPDALDYLKNGKLAVTVFQDAPKMAQLTIETAVKAAKGEKIDKEIKVQAELVTQEDADKYIAKWNR